jgi:hypothetical protein
MGKINTFFRGLKTYIAISGWRRKIDYFLIKIMRSKKLLTKFSSMLNIKNVIETALQLILEYNLVEKYKKRKFR